MQVRTRRVSGRRRLGRCAGASEQSVERYQVSITRLPATVLAPAVNRSLDEIVPRLLKRFSSREGYKLYDDTIPTCECVPNYSMDHSLTLLSP